MGQNFHDPYHDGEAYLIILHFFCPFQVVVKMISSPVETLEVLPDLSFQCGYCYLSQFSCFSCFSGPVPFDELEVAVGVVTELLAYGFSVESVDDNDDDDSVVGIVAASLVLGVIELESVGPTEDSADAVLVCLLREKMRKKSAMMVIPKIHVSQNSQ